MENLFKLHCAVEIKFTAEDKYNITYGIAADDSVELAEPEPEKPAPKARKARAPKKAEATA